MSCSTHFCEHAVRCHKPRQRTRRCDCLHRIETPRSGADQPAPRQDSSVFPAHERAGALSAIAMMNAGRKRARISAALVLADLRQVTNEIEEAHQYSILADAIQRDRCFLLSSYESVSLAYTMARSTLRVLTWKSTGRQPTAEKCCARSGATREPALLISLKSNLPFFDLGHSRRGQNEKSDVSRST